jgi:hypothetical protein
MAHLRRENDAPSKGAPAVMSGSLCKVRTSFAAEAASMCDSISSVLQKSRARSVVIFNSSDACCIKNERLSVCIEVRAAHHKKSPTHKHQERLLFFLPYKNIHARGKFDSGRLKNVR